MLEFTCRMIFRKLILRLHNYQKRNPIEYQTFNVHEIKVNQNDYFADYYIKLIFLDRYEIRISAHNGLSFSIQQIDRSFSNYCRFSIVPPITINQEDIKFVCNNTYTLMPLNLNKDLIKMFEQVFKMKFHDDILPYFTTKNDVLSQS